MLERCACIAEYFDKATVEDFGFQLKCVAAIFHGCNTNGYHIIFRLIFSEILDCANELAQAHFNSSLDLLRKHLGKSYENLKSVINLAIELNMSMAKVVHVLQKWAALASCSKALAKNISRFLELVVNVKALRLNAIVNEDRQFANALLVHFAPRQVICTTGDGPQYSLLDAPEDEYQTIMTILERNLSPWTFRAIINEMDWKFQLVMGWWSFNPIANMKCNLFLLCFKSSESLARFLHITKLLNCEEDFAKILQRDLSHAWIHGIMRQELVEMLLTLTEDNIAELVESLCRMRLGSILRLTGNTETFLEIFPFFGGIVVSEEQLILDCSDDMIVNEMRSLAEYFFTPDNFAFNEGLDRIFWMNRVLTGTVESTESYK